MAGPLVKPRTGERRRRAARHGALSSRRVGRRFRQPGRAEVPVPRERPIDPPMKNRAGGGAF